MAYWSKPELPRDQILLIPTALGDRIPEDHPVRLFHEILTSLDWSSWENRYCQVRGRPAIPPMVVAGAILYGMSQGIRSSRRRTVARDQHDAAREAASQRMQSEAGRTTYARRAWMAETPRAVIKTCFGLRQFLLRGLEKVRTEWLWACTTFNLWKLVRAIASMRRTVAAQVG